jgi:LPS-assembly protein
MFQNDSSDIMPKILPVAERNISTELFQGTLEANLMFVNLDFSDSMSSQNFLSNSSLSWTFAAPHGNIFDVKLLMSMNGTNVSEKRHSNYNSIVNITPQMSVVWKWPLLITSDFAETIFTPIVGIITADNRKRFNAFEYPFYEINDLNFLEGSRIPSLYNVDFGSRICYGIKMSSYLEGKDLLHLTVGRSTELASTPQMQEATGLKYRSSDIVTSADVFVLDNVTLTTNGSYSTRNRKFTRAESGFRLSYENFGSNLFVFTGNELSSSPFLHDVRQLEVEQRTQKYRGSMLDAWWQASKTTKLKAGITFGSENNKFIRCSFGVEYKNECSLVELSVERTNYRIGDVKPGISLRLNIHLKNLGW